MAEQKPKPKSGVRAVRDQVARAQDETAIDHMAIADRVELILSSITLPGSLFPRPDDDPIRNKYRAFFTALLNGSGLQFAIQGAGISNAQFRDWMRKGGDEAHNGGEDKTDEAEDPFKTFALTVRACQANAVNSLYGYVMSAAKTDWRAAQVLLNRRDPVPQQGITVAASAQSGEGAAEVVIYIPDNGRTAAEQVDASVIQEQMRSAAEDVRRYYGESVPGDASPNELPPVSAMPVIDAEVIEADITDIDDVPNFLDMPMDEGE